MPVTMSDVPRTAFRHDDRLQALPAHAGFQRRLRRDPPVARLVEIGQFAPVVHDEQHVVVPQPPEVAACERARTARRVAHEHRSEEHTSELQSLMRISYAVFCLKKKKTK